MIPTRTTRSSSRRSSILKPPKPRQPLQNLNFTNSFSESSPIVTTTKLKRRVSFAEKKHVKEFCNSLEQGTVWDSTYEEHDLSNLKAPCIVNKDCNESTCKENVEITTDHHNDLVSVNPETVGKCTINETSICYIRDDHEAVSRVASEEIELIYKQPNEKEVLPDSSPKSFDSAAREINESALSLELPVSSESYVHRCFGVFEDPAANVSSKVVNGQDSNANNFKSNKMNATCVMNTHMGFTEALSHNIHPSINFTEGEKISKTLQNTMSEFREVVPTSIQLLNNMKSVQQPIEDLNPNCYKSPIPDVDLKAESPQNFKNLSIDMTMAVSTIPFNLQEKEPYAEYTQNFNDTLMKMTTVTTNAECSKHFDDDSMEMTAAVPTRTCNMQGKETYTEHTRNVNNVSMEMTAAIPTRLCTLQEKETYAECTKNFNNASMEMTAAVPTRTCNMQGKETYTERTRNFNNVSMEMTAAVPTRTCNMQGKETYTERTRNFNNVSMEMTAAIPTRLCNLQEKETYAECTKNFNNASMEMTAAVPTRACNMQGKETYMEHSKNVNNASMEITGAVPTKLYGLQEKSLKSDKTTSIFHDVSINEGVPINVYAGRMHRDEIRDDILSSIKTIKKNENDATCMNKKIMNLADAGNGNNFENSRCSVNSHRTKSFDKTEIYKDKGMKFTTAISTVRRMQSGNKTRIFDDNSMTTTAVVSCLNDTGTVLQSRNVNVESDKTSIFDGNSMAITAVVPPLNEMDVSEEKGENHESNVNAQDSHKTISFPNISMEMTEAMSSLESIPKREEDITNMSEITRTRLPENIENRSSTDSLKRSSIPDNVLRDITVLVVPPLLDSSESSEERNCTMNHAEFLEAKIVEEPFLSEVPGLEDIEANTASHDSPVQDISASALNLDNTGAACVTPNSASNDFLHTVTPNANQECLPHKHAKDTVPYHRRTYTIKPLSTDHSFTDNINEYSQSTETNNDMQNADSFQAQAFFEKSCTLLDKGLEELEAIQPPSFLCLDNSIEDVPMNTNHSREVVLSSQTVQDLPEETLKLDQQKVVDVSRKEICLESQQIRLSSNDSAIAEVQEFECSSSTTNKDPKIFTYNVISPPRDKDTWNNSNTENQNMEQPVLDISEFDEEKHLQSDEVKLHSNRNTLNNAMEMELQEIDPQISLVNNDVSIELDPFSSLVKELRTCAQSDEIIWEVYHENIEKKWFIVGFISCSLLIVVYLGDDYDISGGQIIKDIKIISRLADDADTLISMVHRLILEKIDVIKLIDLYKSVEDITSMFDYISKEVKLALNFMFDLKRLDDLNLMTITRDSVSFVSHTEKMDIILKVTVIIKPFEKINSQDISVHCLLGSVRESEIKKLMKNVKKDHKFLRRFMSDVRDYIYVMEVSPFATNVP